MLRENVIWQKPKFGWYSPAWIDDLIKEMVGIIPTVRQHSTLAASLCKSASRSGNKSPPSWHPTDYVAATGESEPHSPYRTKLHSLKFVFTFHYSSACFLAVNRNTKSKTLYDVYIESFLMRIRTIISFQNTFRLNFEDICSLRLKIYTKGVLSLGYRSLAYCESPVWFQTETFDQNLGRCLPWELTFV